ncbi:site-specific integrase [Meiothermus sp.]|uniref:site-specific integrase n=1 Tax=Meiothermus sp. TaxID=1955249 RepID=UPI00262AC5AF|nr:site-specific integrase [Meiothermus sp.]
MLYLLGEAGVWPKELFALRLEDFQPAARVLRVRGQKARSVPLSKEATEALLEYLEDRESVASLAPLPSPYLFLRMTPKKGGLGRPLNRDTLDGLLVRALEMSGLDHPRPTGALRWRAVRRYLQQGLSPQEVARRTGVASVLSLKE